ncbi:NUMOD3 domain-containing DNA-binding protein [Mesorhizobium amorphae]|uniref:NUMOD3 domain-containing DNA-binding protein n=1 Tax=Mesorhizobium amorphae TaxID=71433 RepID=UPI0011851D02|nr:NUMOD3 domain-containing DNA-binding protein [Mesorhizobium amorphae]
MFIENKYYRWYLAVVANDCPGRAVERHHKVPRSLGGTNDPANIVRLTLRKHFLAHWLLTKCTEGVARKKMLKALGCMIGNRKARISSWQYAVARQASHEGRRGEPSPNKGKSASAETRRKQSEAKRGRTLSAEHRAKIGASGVGRVFSEETREKIRVRKRGFKLSEEHCRKIGESKRGIVASLETRQKISAALVGNRHSIGRIHPPETRAKMVSSRRENLQALSNNKLGLKGVVRHPGSRFRARTRHAGKIIEIGVFDCPVAAHLAYVVVNNSLLKGSPK